MKKSLLIVLTFVSHWCFAQNPAIDSLKNWINTHPNQDSLRVVNLHKISYRLSEINPSEAWTYAFATYRLAQKLQNSTSIGLSYINYALLESANSDFAQSHEHYLMAVKLFEKSGWERGIAISYNNIADNYLKQGQYTKCIEYTQLAMIINQKIGQKRGEVINIEQLSAVYFAKKEYAKSLEYAQKGLSLCMDKSTDFPKAQLLLDYAKVQVAIKDYKKAFYSFEEVITLGNAENAKFILLNCHQEMAKMYRIQQDLPKVFEHLRKAETFAIDLKSDLEMATIQKEFYHSFLASKDYQNALSAYQKYSELSKSIAAKKNIQRTELIELKFKNQSQLKENQRLVGIKDNLEQISIRKSSWILALAFLVLVVVAVAVYMLYRYQLEKIQKVAEAQQETIKQMQVADKIRTQISQDLHDDLGATLSSISMLSKVAKRKLSTDNQEVIELVDTINESSQRTVKTIRDIIWTTNSMNDELGKISEKMNSFAHETLEPHQINYEINIDKSLLDHKLQANQKYHFYLIFKEAINNIAKYAKASKVMVDMFTDKEFLVMKIGDNGIGFDVIDKKGKGNGLINMENRALAMAAQYDINSSIGQGTTLILKMPM